MKSKQKGPPASFCKSFVCFYNDGYGLIKFRGVTFEFSKLSVEI